MVQKMPINIEIGRAALASLPQHPRGRKKISLFPKKAYAFAELSSDGAALPSQSSVAQLLRGLDDTDYENIAPSPSAHTYEVGTELARSEHSSLKATEIGYEVPLRSTPRRLSSLCRRQLTANRTLSLLENDLDDMPMIFPNYSVVIKKPPPVPPKPQMTE